MKSRLFILRTVLLTMFVVGISIATCIAEEMATKEECFSKVSEASRLIQEIGSKAAFKKIMDKDEPFIWKNAHVICLNAETGILLAHPDSNRVGFHMRYYTDADGKYPYAEILDAVKTKDQGWIKYISDSMGKVAPRLKHVHFRKVPGEDIIVCSGYYPSQG